jgi:hypothetical protein
VLVVCFALTGASELAPTGGTPSIESCLLFGLLTGTYTLVLSFALDLNQPFEGVYQVRRSAAATSLLSARQLLAGDLPDGLAFERGGAGGDGIRSSAADPRPC